MSICSGFNSFEISKNMIVQLVVTTVCFLAFILIFWLQGLERANDNRSLALLFVLFMYPTFVVLAFAVIKWRDDKWVMSLFVKTALVVCCALIVRQPQKSTHMHSRSDQRFARIACRCQLFTDLCDALPVCSRCICAVPCSSDRRPS